MAELPQQIMPVEIGEGEVDDCLHRFWVSISRAALPFAASSTSKPCEPRPARSRLRMSGSWSMTSILGAPSPLLLRLHRSVAVDGGPRGVRGRSRPDRTMHLLKAACNRRPRPRSRGRTQLALCAPPWVEGARLLAALPVPLAHDLRRRPCPRSRRGALFGELGAWIRKERRPRGRIMRQGTRSSCGDGQASAYPTDARRTPEPSPATRHVPVASATCRAVRPHPGGSARGAASPADGSRATPSWASARSVPSRWLFVYPRPCIASRLVARAGAQRLSAAGCMIGDLYSHRLSAPAATFRSRACARAGN